MSCAAAGADTATAAASSGKLLLEIEAKERRGGSTVTLEGRSEDAGGCVLRTEFVNELLDAIESRATTRR